MQGFEVIIYTKADGKTPVNEFLYSLPNKLRAKALGELKILAEYGNELREPYTKYIGDGIFELRIKQGSDIARVLHFFYDGKRIVVTNGFLKKTMKIPKREIALARRIREEYLKGRKEE